MNQLFFSTFDVSVLFYAIIMLVLHYNYQVMDVMQKQKVKFCESCRLFFFL